jgi:hypothetical protein
MATSLTKIVDDEPAVTDGPPNLERELLAGLQSKVLRDEVVPYIIDRFEEQLSAYDVATSGLHETASRARKSYQMEGQSHDSDRNPSSGIATRFSLIIIDATGGALS